MYNYLIGDQFVSIFISFLNIKVCYDSNEFLGFNSQIFLNKKIQYSNSNCLFLLLITSCFIIYYTSYFEFRVF